jgi:hypothetical protein
MVGQGQKGRPHVAPEMAPGWGYAGSSSLQRPVALECVPRRRGCSTLSIVQTASGGTFTP